MAQQWFRYDRGQFMPTESPGGEDCEWSELIRRLGFVHHCTQGNNDSIGCDVYSRESTDGRPESWLLDFTMGDHCYAVHAENWFDVLDVLARFGPVFSHELLWQLCWFLDATRDTLHPNVKTWLPKREFF